MQELSGDQQTGRLALKQSAVSTVTTSTTASGDGFEMLPPVTDSTHKPLEQASTGIADLDSQQTQQA